jgi:hypothetical protein
MTGAGCKKKGRKHTPIKSKAQQGKFGAELGRRRKGKKRRMKGITTKELEQHLEESGGKDLPQYVKGRVKRRRKAGGF